MESPIVNSKHNCPIFENPLKIGSFSTKSKKWYVGQNQAGYNYGKHPRKLEKFLEEHSNSDHNTIYNQQNNDEILHN